MSDDRTVEECQKIISFLYPSRKIVFIGYCGEDESEWQIEYGKERLLIDIHEELHHVGWKMYDEATDLAWSISNGMGDYRSFENPITFSTLRACYEKLHEFKMPVDYDEAFDDLLERLL